MSDIRLFRVAAGTVAAIPSKSDAIEKSLQILIERNLEEFLGVRFLASEYATTKSHGGRIDTLGIDETNNPVIVEYMRSLHENVINQGLFYLNWLMDHRADFQLLVMEKLGGEVVLDIDWHYPRLVCIAGDFTKYDVHAIQQIPQNIDLIRYRRFGDDLIMLEQVAKSSTSPTIAQGRSSTTKEVQSVQKATPNYDQGQLSLRRLKQCDQEIQDWYDRLKSYALGLGDGVEERILGEYIAFRHVKNFAFVRFRPTLKRIVIGIAIPSSHQPEIDDDFVKARDDRGVEVHVDSIEDVERAELLLGLSYQNS
jgi:predicted transport protein